MGSLPYVAFEWHNAFNKGREVNLSRANGRYMYVNDKNLKKEYFKMVVLTDLTQHILVYVSVWSVPMLDLTLALIKSIITGDEYDVKTVQQSSQ